VATLNSITLEAVLAAIAEYDRIGQEEFLHRYRFASARQYVLVYKSKRYDSKAIAGVARPPAGKDRADRQGV
jgi:hypothetical protein